MYDKNIKNFFKSAEIWWINWEKTYCEFHYL